MQDDSDKLSVILIPSVRKDIKIIVAIQGVGTVMEDSWEIVLKRVKEVVPSRYKELWIPGFKCESVTPSRDFLGDSIETNYSIKVVISALM